MTKQRLKLTAQQRDRFKRIRRMEQLKSMDPIEFEYFIGYLYERDGYKAYTTVTSGDEGVDLYLQKGKRSAVVQCKRYSGTVGQPTVRDLYGAMIHNNANEGMLVTSGTISRPAEQWAAGKPLKLIDGHEILSWARRTRAPVAAGGSSFQLNSMMMLGIGLFVLLFLCSGLTLLGWQQEWFRGDGPDSEPPVLVVPTPIGGGTPVAGGDTATATAEPADDDVDPIVPTVTLRPTTIASQSQAAVTAQALGNGRSLTVDADLTDWPQTTTYAAPHRIYQATDWNGTEDLEATWQIAWDNDALWLAIQIQDDRHVQIETAGRVYEGDSIELQFDTNIRGDYAAGLNEDDFQILLSPGDFNQLPPSSFRFQGGANTDMERNQVRVAAVQTGDGYIIEARIAWSALAVTPQAGQQIGFALSVNDNDRAKTAIQEVMYTNVSTREWGDPRSWGTLTLEP